MEPQTAEMILYAITAVAGVAWVIGMQFVVRSFRLSQGGELPEAARADDVSTSPPSPPPGLIAGSVELDGSPAELSRKAAAALAAQPSGSQELLKILKREDDQVTFQGTGYSSFGQPVPSRIGYGQLRFTAVGRQRTMVDYAVSAAGGRWLLRTAAGFVVLGLAAIVAGFWLMQSYVIPSVVPGVRPQVVQMLQVSHFLWPQFLCAGLFRAARRGVRTRFEALVHNLPYGT
jgi:hypothetical protein